MASNEVDLASIFQSVTQTLTENQQTLDQADEYNRDHGTNMVQTFQTITDALQKKKGSSASVGLNYAAQQLAQKSTSGSGKLYAQNLAQAAKQVKGKKVDGPGAAQILQTLIGGQTGQPAAQSGGGDLLSGLLGSLTGGGASSQQAPQTGGGDMLSTLLGGLAGGSGQHPPAQSGGGDFLGSLLGNLISGGGLQTLAQAFLGGSGMGDSSHRTQSTQLVINAFLQALSAANKK